jgi:galactokinase
VSRARWFAPGRVNLIGEHTDYNDGLCLPFAIRQGCTAQVETLADGDEVVLTSAQESDTVRVAVGDIDPAAAKGWTAYPLGVLWSLREQGHLPRIPGLRIAVDGDVPAGAGLSSSAALECSVAAAVSDALDLRLSREHLLVVSRQAENDYVGLPNGGLDQMSSLLCEAGHALLADFSDLSTQQVPFDVTSVGAAVLVLDTKAPHRLTDGAYADRRATCDAAARDLGVASLREVDVRTLDDALSRLDDDTRRRAVRHVVTENQRVVDTVARLERGDLWGIGDLLTASHVSLRDDFRVTVPELDVAQEALVDAGAAGARMTGGGFGGCVIALLADDRVEPAARAVVDAFAEHGFRRPEWFTATPGPGAHTA